MTAPINGHTPPPPHLIVARGVYDACFEDGDTPWDDLADEQREQVAEYVEIVMQEHIKFLTAGGVQIIPPGAAPIPKTQDQALAMVQAAKTFFDAQKRGGKLLATTVQPKLIVPPGTKLQ